MPHLSRRSFLAATAAVPLSAFAAKPNIVHIMLDDQGPAEAGCYGSTTIHTPNIDKLAASGMKFTQAYAGCTVCAPARSTLMTGTHMGHTPVRANPGGVSMRAEDVTIAQVLKKAGYVCGGFGKWGLGDLDTPGVPERHGFDKFVGYYHQVHAHYYYPDYLIDTGRKMPLPGNEGFYDSKPQIGAFPLKTADGRTRQFSGYVIFDEMKKWLTANKNKPFYCYAPWTIPHGRYEIPESDPAWALYRDKPWRMAARVHAAYVSMADRMVGETIALLKDAGVLGNTLIIFSSDNGAPNRYENELDSAKGLRGQKTTMYEGGLRVPFIASWPGRVKGGSVSDAPVYFPDLMPTFIEVAGAQQHLPKSIDGASLVSELTGTGRIDRNRPLYWEWNRGHMDKQYTPTRQALRRGRWKLMRDEAGQPWELYDLIADPGETKNLASEYAAVVKQMEQWIAANRVDPPPQIEPSKPAGQRWR
jgi:arylsulfatase A